MLQDLIVLESTAGGDAVVSIMTEDGFIKSTVTPSQSDPCGLLKSPVAVAVDDAHNVFIVATGLDGIKRIVMFGANGRFQREIIGPNAAERGLIGSEASRRTTVWPAGVATGVNGQLYAVMRGDRIAEIRLIEYA